MIKAKFVLGLAVVAMFAFTTTPALARVTNHGGKGEVSGGVATFSFNDEVFTVSCTGASGLYKVSAEGTALTLEEIEWKGCKSAIGTTATAICTLKLNQPNKEGTEKGTATGALLCTVSSAGCVIKIENNNELKIPLAKSGAGVLIEIKLANLTASGSACELGGGGKEKIKEAKVEAKLTAEGLGLE